MSSAAALLQDPKVFRILIDAFVEQFVDQHIDVVAGIDARGFILGSVVAYGLNRGFVPVRKAGKLPGDTVSISYDLEYGSTSLEMHKDALGPGRRVVLVDDVLFSGRSTRAALDALSDGEPAADALVGRALDALDDEAAGQVFLSTYPRREARAGERPDRRRPQPRDG